MNEQQFSDLKNEIRNKSKYVSYSLRQDTFKLAFFAHLDKLSSNVFNMFFKTIFVFLFNLLLFSSFLSLAPIIITSLSFFFFYLIRSVLGFFSLNSRFENFSNLFIDDLFGYKSFYNDCLSTTFQRPFSEIYAYINQQEALTSEQKNILHKTVLNEKEYLFDEYEKNYFEISFFNFLNDKNKYIKKTKQKIFSTLDF